MNSSQAFVIPQVTEKLSSYSFDLTKFHPSDMDFLINSDLIPAIMKSGVQYNIGDTLLGQQTLFGWILSGPIFNLSSDVTSIAAVDGHHNKSRF